ncbi:PH domain-containing protein [Demequina pelophila]|uniref:PH domain-containing protein n=1 Tax=Demequina pelophila TaxID=1638984 RepID=UPI000783B976|nr:PH domain-containing protein [Demequina pelophila]
MPDTPVPSTEYSAPREWTRLHPITPLLGGWGILGLVAAYFIYDRLPGWVAGDDPTFDFFDQFPVLWILLAAALGVALVIGAGVLQWSRTEYRIGDDAVYLRQGIVTRQQRQARLDRLQAVDVVQPLLARLAGFAAINIQVAGGQKSGVMLKFLRLGDAEALRNEILYLAAGVTGDDAGGEPGVDVTPVGGDQVAGDRVPGDQVTDATEAAAASSGVLAGLGAQLSERAQALGRPEDVLRGTERVRTRVAAAPEREVYSVPTPRLLLSVLFSGPAVFLIGAPLVSLPFLFLLHVDVFAAVGAVLGTSLVAILSALAGFLGFFWQRINGGFGFTAAVSPDGLRMRHGLTQTRRQTVPPGRVQAIRLYQPLLWRRKDWWRITINVAGYGEDQESVSVLHPVATREEALTAVWLILPDLGDPDPAGTLSLAMTGRGDDGGFLTAPPRSKRIDPIQWRYRGVRATERALLIRSGRFTKELVVVPHERTQSLGLQQGPLDRALGLANVVVHSTQGPVRPRAEHLDMQDAFALLDAQAGRAREGRRRQTPEQWMRAVGL